MAPRADQRGSAPPVHRRSRSSVKRGVGAYRPKRGHERDLHTPRTRRRLRKTPASAASSPTSSTASIADTVRTGPTTMTSKTTTIAGTVSATNCSIFRHSSPPKRREADRLSSRYPSHRKAVGENEHVLASKSKVTTSTRSVHCHRQNVIRATPLPRVRLHRATLCTVSPSLSYRPIRVLCFTVVRL